MCPVTNTDANVLGGCPVKSGAPVATDANIAKWTKEDTL